MWIYPLLGLALLIAVPAAYAEIHSDTMSTTLAGSGTYNVVVSCSDAALVYGINLIIPYNDVADQYAIDGNSIRLGAHTLQHMPYASGNHKTNVPLFEAITDLRYPLLIPRHTPLVIPIQVHDDTPGKPAEAILDVTYVADPGVQCTQAGLYGPQRVGYLDNLDPAGVHIDQQRAEATRMAVDDFNQYLKDLGEQWWIEVVFKDNDSNDETSQMMVREFHEEGIDIIVGPSASSSVAAVYDYTKHNDMLLISCCSTAPSLAMPDHIFRMAPDDTNQARALAAVMMHDGVDTAVTIYRNDTYGRGLGDELIEMMEQRGGAVSLAMHYPTDGLDAASVADRLATAIQDLVEENGTDGVAVVVISFSEIVDIAEAALDHPVLSQVRWYGSESVVNQRDMARGSLGAFSDMVSLSGVIQHVSPNPLNMQLDNEMRAQLGLSEGESVNRFAYSAYDAILVLGSTMLATQNSQTDSLTEALPHVAMRTFGALNSDQFNENGDLAAVDYGIWRVMNNNWHLAGTYVQSADAITESP